MKKFYAVAFLLVAFSGVSQVINFADVDLKNALVTASPDNMTARNQAGDYITVDVNGNSEIEQSEALLVYHLHILNLYDVTSAVGLEHFSNLKSLELGSMEIPTLPTSSWPNIEYLRCGGLASIDVSMLSELDHLSVRGSFTALDVSMNSTCQNLESTHR